MLGNEPTKCDGNWVSEILIVACPELVDLRTHETVIDSVTVPPTVTSPAIVLDTMVMTSAPAGTIRMCSVADFPTYMTVTSVLPGAMVVSIPSGAIVATLLFDDA